MISKRSKILFLRILSGMIATVIAVCLYENTFLIQTVYAAEAGTSYTASANPRYSHPVTGDIEDPGNNEAIGQGMTESVTYETALIEQTDSGNMYATVRLKMMDNISNIKFATQEWGSSGWSSASSSVMQENVGGDYTSDFRFQIPNENAVVRVEFYVTPMGRSIIYFIYFSNFAEGSGDFIVSVDSSAGTSAAITDEEIEETQETTATTQTQSSEANTQAAAAASNTNQTVGVAATAGVELAAETESGKKTALQLIEEADGLVLSDDSLLKVAEEDSTDADESEEKISQTITALPWLFVFQCIIILTIPGVVAGMVLLLVMTIQRKRERDNE